LADGLVIATGDRGGGVADLLGPAVRLLLVGVNPGLRSAQVGHHFAGHGNRFWPALCEAGITPRRFTPAEGGLLPALGVGVTNLVARPSARASELSADELRAGGARLTGLVERLTPVVVAVLGVGAYRTAFACPTARVGLQPRTLGPARLWVLPNPSGLNAHVQLPGHVAGLRAVARAAGVGRRDGETAQAVDERAPTG
jgi:TDG/mug DNA glycosylase family protein